MERERDSFSAWGSRADMDQSCHTHHLIGQNRSMPGNLDIPYLVVITYCAAIPLETFAKQTDKLGVTHHSTYSSYFLSSSLCNNRPR